jgi:hypothetical protein
MSHKRIPDNFASEQRPLILCFEEKSLDILTLKRHAGKHQGGASAAKV